MARDKERTPFCRTCWDAGSCSVEKGLCMRERGWTLSSRPGPAWLPSRWFSTETQQAGGKPDRAASFHSGCTAAGSRHRQSEGICLLSIVMWLCALTPLPPSCLLLLCMCLTPTDWITSVHTCIYIYVTVSIFSGNRSLQYWPRALMICLWL